MSHTPGPWSASNWRVCASVDDPEKFRYICDTANNAKTRNNENAANARLIAASPDLLAACKALLAVVDGSAEFVIAFDEGAPRDGVIANLNYAIDLSRVAVAKAEGEKG